MSSLLGKIDTPIYNIEKECDTLSFISHDLEVGGNSTLANRIRLIIERIDNELESISSICGDHEVEQLNK